MERSDINNFLRDISNQLDNDDSTIEEIIALLRTKMLDLSDAYLNYRIHFCKAKNKSSFELNDNCLGFDADCQKSKQPLNNKRKASALRIYCNPQDNKMNTKSAYFDQ